MSQMIEFLTRVGADASLRFGSEESLSAAMSAMGLVGDANGIRAQIVQESTYNSSLMPAFAASLMPAFSATQMGGIPAMTSDHN